MTPLSPRRGARQVLKVTIIWVFLLCPFAGLTAQVVRKPKTTIHVRDMLSAAEAGGSATPAAVVFLERRNYPVAQIDSLMTGLERIAFTASTPFARMEAAQALASAGSGDDPIPGALDRVLGIYSRSKEELVRGIIVSMMPVQADKGRAISFLKVVASASPDAQDFDGGSQFAVESLAKMGASGRSALAELQGSGALRDPRASGYVAWYFRGH